MTPTQQPVRTRTKPIVIVTLITLVATVTALPVWGTRNTDEASAVDRQIESTVTRPAWVSSFLDIEIAIASEVLEQNALRHQ